MTPYIDPFRALCRREFGCGRYPRTKTPEEEAIAEEEAATWELTSAILRAAGASSKSPRFPRGR